MKNSRVPSTASILVLAVEALCLAWMLSSCDVAHAQIDVGIQWTDNGTSIYVGSSKSIEALPNGIDGAKTIAALPPEIAAAATVLLSPALPPMPNAATANAVISTNGTNQAFGPVGIVVPRAKVSFAWTDEKLANPSIVAYNLYCGTDTLGMTNIGKLSTWSDTNEQVYFTVSNIDPALIHYFTASAIDNLGNESDDAPYIEFMAAGWLLVTTNGANAQVSFYATSNHAYTVQSRILSTNAWTNVLSFSNYQGMRTFTETNRSAAKIYRLKIQ